MNAKTAKLINKVSESLGHKSSTGLKKLWLKTFPSQRILFRRDMQAFLAKKLAPEAGVEVTEATPA